MLTLQRSKRIVICISLVLLATSCAPAATPTPVPTAVPPTKAPQPTAVPPTAAPQPTTKPTTAATAVAPTAVPPTKAAVAGPPTLPPTKATPTLVANAPKSADDIQVISPQLLKAMIEGGADIVVVDVQPPEAYVLEHVKGAVNFPWDMRIKSSGGLPYDKLLVVYCACSPDEKASATDAGDIGMQLITTFEYTKIALLDGGWVRWQELGYPTEKGGK